MLTMAGQDVIDTSGRTKIKAQIKAIRSDAERCVDGNRQIPNMCQLLGAVVVYTLALRLFDVAARFDGNGRLSTHYSFRGRYPGTDALGRDSSLMVVFPKRPGAMAALGFIQHHFFILFNAMLGLLCFRRATGGLVADSVTSCERFRGATLRSTPPPDR
jgi:hypothetical protein